MIITVLDTNVFVSGIISTKGNSARIIDAWKDGRFLLAISNPIKNEILKVLRYPRIQRKYKISDERVEHLCLLLKQEAFWTKGQTYIKIARDPKDNMVLQCAK